MCHDVVAVTKNNAEGLQKVASISLGRFTLAEGDCGIIVMMLTAAKAPRLQAGDGQGAFCGMALVKEPVNNHGR